MAFLETLEKIIYLNVRNGALFYTDQDCPDPDDPTKKLEKKVYGCTGIINGIGTREKIYEGQARIELGISIWDESINTIQIVCGTLQDSNTNKITVFGQNILARLACPEGMALLGKIVHLSVSPGTGKEKEKETDSNSTSTYTLCRLRDENRNEIHGFDTKSLPAAVLLPTIDRWLTDAKNHYGHLWRGLYEAELSGLPTKNVHANATEATSPFTHAPDMAEEELPF